MKGNKPFNWYLEDKALFNFCFLYNHRRLWKKIYYSLKSTYFNVIHRQGSVSLLYVTDFVLYVQGHGLDVWDCGQYKLQVLQTIWCLIQVIWLVLNILKKINITLKKQRGAVWINVMFFLYHAISDILWQADWNVLKWKKSSDWIKSINHL